MMITNTFLMTCRNRLGVHRSWLAYSKKCDAIALMMEAARTSETLVNFYQTTGRYNPEDSHLRRTFCYFTKREGSSNSSAHPQVAKLGGKKDLKLLEQRM
jgi:hypothetical protein